MVMLMGRLGEGSEGHVRKGKGKGGNTEGEKKKGVKKGMHWQKFVLRMAL